MDERAIARVDSYKFLKEFVNIDTLLYRSCLRTRIAIMISRCSGEVALGVNKYLQLPSAANPTRLIEGLSPRYFSAQNPDDDGKYRSRRNEMRLQ